MVYFDNYSSVHLSNLGKTGLHVGVHVVCTLATVKCTLVNLVCTWVNDMCT